MIENFFMGVAMTSEQISCAYLRCLPFKKELTLEQVDELRKKFLMWSAVDFILNLILLSEGISYRSFKIAMLIDWVPYFLISLSVIRKKLPQHFFAFGMQSLWCFMLHAFAGMGVALIFGTMEEKFLPLQISFYLILFFALLKVERKFFVNLLPTPQLFAERSLRWYISLLPFAIFLGTVITIVDITFLSTWRERFSRLVFPIFFVIIYQSMSNATRRVKEKYNQEQHTRLLRRQMESLAEQNALMQKSQREVLDLQKNLSANYRTLDDLLAKEKIADAMKYIRRQANLLDTTRVQVFCLAPLVNAALSIYFRRAEENGIKVTHKIDLPATFSTDESDLAVLLSNLLENAITAGKRQPPDARDLSLFIRHVGNQYVLEISNRYDFPIKLGENGLPYSTKIGHGLGMTSLGLFAKKYDAYVDFSHENNRVQLVMYWNDR